MTMFNMKGLALSGPRHLVTGATGFVGAALVIELLNRTDDTVLALVRPGAEGASVRMKRAIEHAANAYGLDPAELPLHRLQTVAGDVTEPRCGMRDSDLRFDVLWHSAASLRYENRYEREILSTNVDGTINALDLARSAGATVVNQISTAYVVGRTEGVILEEPTAEPPHQNHYERSKVAAEAMMRAAAGLRVRILRPSIVVGHSRTLAATTFSGLYGFARQLYQFRGVMQRTQRGLLQERPLRMRVSPDQPLSLVPVDEVAAQSACIGLQSDAEGVYHLTQRQPRSISDTILAVTRSLGFADPEFVARDAPLEWLDEQLDKRLDFYGAYIQGTKHFDRRRSDAALANHADTYRDLPSSAEMVSWYLKRLAAERAAMPAAR